MGLKYEVTDRTNRVDGRILFEIRRFDGLWGGWIESEDNLSQEGNCWIANNACVFGDARVFGNAQVSENAMIFGEAQVSNRAKIYGEAKIHGSTRVNGDAEIFGNADISSNIIISGNTKISSSWETFIDNIWENAPVFNGMVDNKQLQKMLDFVSEDNNRAQLFCSLIHGGDDNAIRQIIFNDAYYEDFDKYDSDVAEKFIWYYQNFKEAVLKGETRGF